MSFDDLLRHTLVVKRNVQTTVPVPTPGSAVVTTTQEGVAAPVGDVAILAEGTPVADVSSLQLAVRVDTVNSRSFSVTLWRDQPNSLGFGANNVVMAISRHDANNEAGRRLAITDLGLVDFVVEWQVRLEISGDPSAVDVRAKAWPTGGVEPAWTSGTDDYPLIARSNDTATDSLTITAIAGIGEVNEVQQITLDATGGTWTLYRPATDGGPGWTLGPYAHDVDPSVIEEDAASAWGDGSHVALFSQVGRVYTVEFVSFEGGRPQVEMIADGANLTTDGGTEPVFDDYGQPVMAPVTVATVAGRIQPKNAREVALTSQAGAVVATHTGFVRPIAGLDTGCWIESGGVRYDIVGMPDAAGAGHHLELELVAVV